MWEVLEQVIAHPELHDQKTWRDKTKCGTVRCIAGWAAFLGGFQDVWSNIGGIDRETLVLSPEGEILYVEDAALRALDVARGYLDRNVSTRMAFASAMFSGNLDFDDVLGAVRDYARADGVIPTPTVSAEMHERGVISDEEYAAWN
jgi:hypothetical protein